MITKELQEALAEVNMLLDNVEVEIVETIPLQIRNFIKNNATAKSTFKYDTSKNLVEQKLMPETRGIISFLYKEYICDENEKKEFMNKYFEFTNHSDQQKVGFNAEVLFGPSSKKELLCETPMPYVKQPWYEKVKSVLEKVFIRRKK